MPGFGGPFSHTVCTTLKRAFSCVFSIKKYCLYHRKMLPHPSLNTFPHKIAFIWWLRCMFCALPCNSSYSLQVIFAFISPSEARFFPICPLSLFILCHTSSSVLISNTFWSPFLWKDQWVPVALHHFPLIVSQSLVRAHCIILANYALQEFSSFSTKINYSCSL